MNQTLEKRDELLLEILESERFITPEEIERARAIAARTGASVVNAMVAEKIITTANIAMAKANHFGFGFVNLEAVRIETDVLAEIPASLAWCYQIIPIEKDGNGLTLAVADPSDLESLDSIGYILHSEVAAFKVADEVQIRLALVQYYASGMEEGLWMRGENSKADPNE